MAQNHGTFVTPPLLIIISQECVKVKQLRLVGSHNTSLEAVAHGTLELDLLQIRKCHFLSDLACLDISSKKKCL